MSRDRQHIARLRRGIVRLEAGLASAVALVQSAEEQLSELREELASAEGVPAAGRRVVIEDWRCWASEVATALKDPDDDRVLVYAPDGVESGEASTPESRALSRGSVYVDLR